MNYRGRPVFDVVDVNWREVPAFEFNYDLRSVLLGFGYPTATPVQTYVVQGVQVSIDLLTAAEIVAFDDFFQALTGGLVGFWIPNPKAAMEITGIDAADTFRIKKQRLNETWDQRPDIDLVLIKKGRPWQFAQIVDVTLDGDEEIVELNEAPTDAIDDSWQVFRLTYVRLAGDTEEAIFRGENRQERRLQVLELPFEYAAAETGKRPIYLYHFWIETDPEVHWRFTSFQRSVDSNGQTFLTKNMSHGALTDSAKSDRGPASIDAWFEAGHPLALFIPWAVAKPVWVEIIETSVQDPDTTTLLCTRRVRSVRARGKKLTATFRDDYEDKIPSFLLEEVCNHSVYEPNTCRKNQALYQIEATITQLAGNAIIVTAAGLADKEENWFAQGWIETGAGGNFETRAVMFSEAADGNSVVLTLDAPLVRAAVGQTILVVPGCNGTSEMCIAKFDNFINWGAVRSAPNNLAIKIVDRDTSHGNVK